MATAPSGNSSPGALPHRGACRLALAGACVAVCAAGLAVAAGFGSRLGVWHFRTGFSILHWSAWIGVISVAVSVTAAILSGRTRNWRCLGIALAGGALGAVVFLLPLNWRMTARRVPPIHDITTDVVRPPPFIAILPLRQNASNPPEYGGQGVADQQQKAYPEIRTLIVEMTPDQAFARALQVARSMGWRIVAQVPEEGRIEATDTTFWFGFTDDMVVRITPAGYRCLVDIRSVSRVGKSDAGTNAARIGEFFARFTGR